MRRTARGLADRRAFVERAQVLRERGELDRIPNLWQLVQGNYRMFVDFIIPASRQMYRESGKHYEWQQLLRFLDEPSAIMDPIGFGASRDMIISHLVQVTHHEAAYDVELLRMWPGGIAELLRQLRLLVAGEHPRQAGIAEIVEYPDYHERLLRALEAYLEDPESNPRLRVMDPPEGFDVDSAWERWATPAKLLTYCAKMPRTPWETTKAVVRGRTKRGRTRRAA